ncbi:MAG: single-stranded-DNA-specific exonuclease RecJ [Edaphobacter sp.]|uniref:single-stranded-DNA-specific exonuclease RecJ n=1 Tax=Edaphobacter sp. TaxID=1934404 RepID=UPI00238E460B|nr:single-stranded-DNA-specific exonuclease RecJ [Edaphobacter sp.]MDE1176295.1 single-stranded-DNA-specific exonuclease RecJ [Edaphobacter sp.]
MVGAQTGNQRDWITLDAPAAAVADVIAAAGCPEGIARLLVTRGFVTSDSVAAFFSPSLSDLHSPMLMLGMPQAVERIRRAIAASEPILIYGDYDVDGTTATVLLKTAIERCAPKETPAIVRYHVPHRIREGYGMQTGVLADAAAAGVRLVISVDTGIRAFAAAAEAKTLGLDLIVTDHHLPDDAAGVPDALSVINPAQPGCPYPFKSLCGAAVAFKLAHALLDAACDDNAARRLLETRLIPSFLKLVAIATIADSVPLEGENRVLAMLGLRELANPVQPGLRALMEVAEIPTDRAPTAMEVGFRIGPRINAAGRMDVASDVVELFLTRDQDRARELAAKLNRLNDERKATEAQALEAIDARLAEMEGTHGGFPALCLVMDDAEWHRGVIGILASRIVDRTGRPALVLTHEDGHAHGSGRSIDGYHLLDALTTAHTSQAEALFTRFGGHAHAVGFSLPTSRIALLRECMEAHSAEMLAGELLSPPLECDVELRLSEVTTGFHGWLERCGPFGIGNPEPLFLTRGVTLAAFPRVIKERHVCLEISDGSNRISAMGWARRGLNWAERASAMSLGPGSRLDIVYRLRFKTNSYFTGLELEMVEIRHSQA